MRISDWSSDVCSSDLGYAREVREDPRPISRGDQEAKAAGERQPRRGMFDGFKPKPNERPAPGRVQGEKPKRGMFDGLQLDATPATPSPARADRGEARALARAVQRTSRSAEGLGTAWGLDSGGQCV